MSATVRANIPILKRGEFREQRGSMLFLCMVFIGILAFAIVIGYSFWGLLFVNSRLHTAADEIALAGAKRLNDRDRMGQMNNMIERCRHLVFASRKDLDKTKSEIKDLEEYSEMLLNEAQDSARDLETERKNVLTSAKSDANTAMNTRYNQIKTSFPMQLPWMVVGTPEFKIEGYGKVKLMESNVEEFGKITDLIQKDRDSNYVKNYAKGIALYEGESEGRLPEEGSLVFKLSSLPAPVKETIAPARTFLQKEFEKEKIDTSEGYFPSAAKVTLTLDVAAGLGPQAGSKMEATGAAITTGGLPMR